MKEPKTETVLAHERQAYKEWLQVMLSSFVLVRMFQRIYKKIGYLPSINPNGCNISRGALNGNRR